MSPIEVHDRAAAPATTAERSLAPDLGRGFMLLAIALAHAHLLLYNPDYVPSAMDRTAVFLRELLVDDRARPMFFFLFGYGLVQLASRQEARGADRGTIRPLLRRRGWWLVLIGLAHAAVIGVDIVSVYGFALVLFAGLLYRSDEALLRIAFWTLLAMGAYFFLMSFGEASSNAFMAFDPAAGDTGLGEMAASRTFSWAYVVLAYGWQVLPGMLLGIWAARRRLLEAPQDHRPMLRRAAIGGIGLALAGGLPWALMTAGIWSGASGPAGGTAGAVHAVTGLAGGVGAIAAIALVSIRFAAKQGPIVTMIAAVGQRSLTFYMFQSVVFLAVLSPVALGLGGRTGFMGAALVACATWVLSLGCAEAMRRRSYRGPAEILLRRLTYGRPSHRPL
jgi:uncharacterized membrane protein YeiB